MELDANDASNSNVNNHLKRNQSVGHSKNQIQCGQEVRFDSLYNTIQYNFVQLKLKGVVPGFIR